MSRAALRGFQALALLAALGLKWFQSGAGADQLGWLLGPACWLAERISTLRFEREPGAGWIDHAHRMIVGESCSGMNFLILTHAALYLSTVHRLTSRAAGWAWLGGSLAAAWLVTVTTNAARLAIVAPLASFDLPAFLTRGAAHQAAGAIVFCLGLVLAHRFVVECFDRLGRPAGERRVPPAVSAVGWYLAMTIGVPLLTMLWRGSGPGRFGEHAVIVLGSSLLALLATLAIRVPGSPRRSAREAGP